MKKLFITLVLFYTYLCSSQGEVWQNKLDSLQRKIIEVEQKLDARDKELIDLKKSVNFAFNVAVDAKDKAYKTERELWSEQFGWLAQSIAVIAAIFGFFIGWFGLRKLLENRANTIFNDYLNKRLKGLKDSQITTLLSEIESSAWKSQIRNKKLLLLNQTDTILPKDLLTALGVFDPEIHNIHEPKDAFNIDFKKYTLVILENYESVGFWDLQTNRADMISLADKVCSSDTAFIYYGEGRKGFFPETNINKHLVNFANSPSQLYNNVMNTLKFQDLLSKTKT